MAQSADFTRCYSSIVHVVVETTVTENMADGYARMACPCFQFLAKQDICNGRVSVEETDFMFDITVHHVLQDTEQGSNSCTSCKHDKMVGLIIPRIRKKPTLRGVCHQFHALGELSVDKGTPNGTTRFLDHDLWQWVVWALDQTV